MASHPQRLAASALIALAAGPFFMASGMAAAGDSVVASAAVTSVVASPHDKALAASVADALGKSLGDGVKNVQVGSNDGVVTLSGWVTSPKQETQARKIASTVPGATHVYSRLRTWSSEDLN